MAKDRAPQPPSSTENRMKICTASNSVFIFPYRVSMAGSPQRRYTAGASWRNRLAACRVFRPLAQWFKERAQHEAEACKRRRFDLASRGVSGQGNGKRKPREIDEKGILDARFNYPPPLPTKALLHWARFSRR